MQKKEAKDYKIEDLMPFYDARFPGTIVFIPKDYIWMSVTGVPEEMKEPYPEPQQKSIN
ncbi:MAG: hypothetical protein KAX15_00090 [Candidatus Omnitrophica bacterium]|nr:hypothetical protein [Candidatus Omnitrophota bacterium]